MSHRICIEAVDRSLRDITRSNLRLEESACYFLENSDKFCRSFTEVLELRCACLRQVFGVVCRLSHSTSYGKKCAFRLFERPECGRDSTAVSGLSSASRRRTSETAEDGIVELSESVQKVLDIDTLCSTVFDGLESNYSDVR